jgi:hypothetical protein
MFYIHQIDLLMAIAEEAAVGPQKLCRPKMARRGFSRKRRFKAFDGVAKPTDWVVELAGSSSLRRIELAGATTRSA